MQENIPDKAIVVRGGRNRPEDIQRGIGMHPSGIDREIFFDPRHTAKHLPETDQVQRLLKRRRSAHVFNDETTLYQVAQDILDRGEYIGIIREYERYGLRFTEPIGYRIDPNGSRIPLFYGEVTDAENRYHVIPRTPPSQV